MAKTTHGRDRSFETKKHLSPIVSALLQRLKGSDEVLNLPSEIYFDDLEADARHALRAHQAKLHSLLVAAGKEKGFRPKIAKNRLIFNPLD